MADPKSKLRKRARRGASLAFDFLFPKKCAICGEVIAPFDEGELCVKCLAAYSAQIALPCRRCARHAADCRCSSLRRKNVGAICGVIGFYRSPSDEVGRLIYSFKREYSRDLTRFFARSLAAGIMRSLGPTAKNAVVTYPPRSGQSLAKYGFDHARYLARETARFLGAEWAPLLSRKGGGVQKALSAKERSANVSDVFSLRRGVRVAERTVIILDDVVTTGATLGSAAAVLREAGAARVIPAALFVTAEKPNAPESDGTPWFEQDDDTDDGIEEDLGF